MSANLQGVRVSAAPKLLLMEEVQLCVNLDRRGPNAEFNKKASTSKGLLPSNGISISMFIPLRICNSLKKST